MALENHNPLKDPTDQCAASLQIRSWSLQMMQGMRFKR